MDCFSLQMDSVLYAEFLMWKEHPSLDRSSAFLSRMYREDIGPCLSFTRSEVRISRLLCRTITPLHVLYFIVAAVHSCPSWCRVQWKTTLWLSSLWPCQHYRWLKPQRSSAEARSESTCLYSNYHAVLSLTLHFSNNSQSTLKIHSLFGFGFSPDDLLFLPCIWEGFNQRAHF